MPPKLTAPSALISTHGYDVIVSSDRLRSALLPDGLLTSPYEVLDYRGVLLLTDPKGRQAIFRRRQKIRFLHRGVTAILDHVWGEGASIEYSNSAGEVVDSIVDGKYRHIVIDLGGPTEMGKVVEFSTSRTLLGMFLRPHEWWEFTPDHPIRQVSQTVVFPAERPCLMAELEIGADSRELLVTELPDGRTQVSYPLVQPEMNQTVRVRWSW